MRTLDEIKTLFIENLDKNYDKNNNFFIKSIRSYYRKLKK